MAPKIVQAVFSFLLRRWPSLADGITGRRRTLPQRRHCEHVTFEHHNFRWTASIGRFPDGSMAEIFLTSTKQGSLLEAHAQDACVATSIALQYGAPIETIRPALIRDSRGEAHGPLGAALDIICKGEPK